MPAALTGTLEPYLLCLSQAYTSQFVALIMFGLMMSEDRISLQKRRLEIINGLRMLPGKEQPAGLTLANQTHGHFHTAEHLSSA